MSEEKITSKEQMFVEAVIERCKTNKGLAAKLRRADNPALEYQSWEFIGAWNINLENTYERLPYVTIAAAIAKAKVEKNGKLTLGKAILACYDNDRDNDQAKAKLRRLLACTELAEACLILRPLLTLINSRVSQPLDYTRLLKQLRYFNDRTRTQWAQEFYSYNPSEKTQEKAL